MALNYVWSGNQPVGSSWNNAYSSRARMIALQSGSLDDPRWRSERRAMYATTSADSSPRRSVTSTPWP
ncbi:MAG: DUF3047 domain-containing protein [Candidatus Sedimenticola endophacoides]